MSHGPTLSSIEARSPLSTSVEACLLWGQNLMNISGDGELSFKAESGEVTAMQPSVTIIAHS
jgi:hypothetical protein